jgi:hypothetical protein
VTVQKLYKAFADKVNAFKYNRLQMRVGQSLAAHHASRARAKFSVQSSWFSAAYKGVRIQARDGA